jgi:hypothetical protein
MTTDDDKTRTTSGLSRRSILTGAGVAATGAVALAAVGAGTAEADVPGAVATGPHGSTVVEFRGRIQQTGSTGETFTSYGFLYSVRGAPDADLFDGGTTDVGHALLTVYATGQLVARVFDQAVHALDIDGTLTVYQRSSAGADWSDPSSFAVGTAVGAFDVTIQDVLTVFTPGKGLPVITGDMRQSQSKALGGSLAGHRFGVRGQRLRMSANGLGTLVDPTTFNSLHEIAGNWTAV